MDNAMKGLFGGGEEGAARKSAAEDFIKRVSDGAPDEGFDADEAKQQLNSVLQYADADQVKTATKEVYSKLSTDQKKAFGDFVGQLQGRTPSADGSSGISEDDIADLFGQAGGSAGSLDDLLGSLMGGATGSSSGGSSGGLGGMLSSMLGGLLGGSKSNTGATSGGDGGVDLGDLLSSPTGKAVIGGLAAILTKNMLDGK